MIITLMFLLGASIGYNIYQRKENKRLHECWDDVFNAKLDSERKWYNLCKHYLERIDELQTENEGLKQKVGNKKEKQNARN